MKAAALVAGMIIGLIFFVVGARSHEVVVSLALYVVGGAVAGASFLTFANDRGWLPSAGKQPRP